MKSDTFLPLRALPCYLCFAAALLASCRSVTDASGQADGLSLIRVEATVVKYIPGFLVILPGVSTQGQMESSRFPAVLLEHGYSESSSCPEKMIVFLSNNDDLRHLRGSERVVFFIPKRKLSALAYSGAELESRPMVFFSELSGFSILLRGQSGRGHVSPFTSTTPPTNSSCAPPVETK